MYESDLDGRKYNDHKSSVFKIIRKRYIVDERVIKKSDFKVNNMIYFLESRSIMHALEYAKPYYVDWIAEFYVNLKKSTGNRMSSNFRVLRFRDSNVVINPDLINKFLSTKPMVKDNVDDINEVVSVLTSGKHGVWTLQFSTTNVTSLYSVLH